MNKKLNNKQLTNRIYVKNNREVWGKLGFRYTTLNVHNDDREKLAALAACWQHEKLSEVATDSETPHAVIMNISRRNMTPLAEKGDIKELEVLAEKYENYRDLMHLIDEVQKLRRRYRAIENNYNDANTVEQEERAIAKAICCSNLLAAKIRYVKAVMQQSPRKGIDPKKVFEPQGSEK